MGITFFASREVASFQARSKFIVGPFIGIQAFSTFNVSSLIPSPGWKRTPFMTKPVFGGPSTYFGFKFGWFLHFLSLEISIAVRVLFSLVQKSIWQWGRSIGFILKPATSTSL